jgi:hypothetical protein
VTRPHVTRARIQVSTPGQKDGNGRTPQALEQVGNHEDQPLPEQQQPAVTLVQLQLEQRLHHVEQCGVALEQQGLDGVQDLREQGGGGRRW